MHDAVNRVDRVVAVRAGARLGRASVCVDARPSRPARRARTSRASSRCGPHAPLDQAAPHDHRRGGQERGKTLFGHGRRGHRQRAARAQGLERRPGVLRPRGVVADRFTERVRQAYRPISVHTAGWVRIVDVAGRRGDRATIDARLRRRHGGRLPRAVRAAGAAGRRRDRASRTSRDAGAHASSATTAGRWLAPASFMVARPRQRSRPARRASSSTIFRHDARETPGPRGRGRPRAVIIRAAGRRRWCGSTGATAMRCTSATWWRFIGRAPCDGV